MKKLFIIIALLLSSLPLFSMDLKEIEGIIKSMADTQDHKQGNIPNRNVPAEVNIEKQQIKEQENDFLFSFPSPDEALLKSGIQLFEASLYNNSKKNFEELITKYPDSPFRDLAFIWLSKINIELNNSNEAINILNQINHESGEYPASLLYLGNIYLKKGEENTAIEYYYKIVSLFPNHELADDSLISLSKLYLKNNKGNQALEAAIRVVKNYKDRETVDDAFFLIGLVFEKDYILKDFTVAKRIYKIFLKKANIDKVPFFYNSPLLDRVENNLRNIEMVY